MSTLNVLRYSALGAGIIYGAVHRYSLESEAASAKARKAFEQEQKLIKKGKEEYAKLYAKPAPTASSTSSSSINWEDPNLDIGQALESLIKKLE